VINFGFRMVLLTMNRIPKIRIDKNNIKVKRLTARLLSIFKT